MEAVLCCVRFACGWVTVLVLVLRVSGTVARPQDSYVNN